MSFYTEVIMKDPRFHSTTVCKDINLLEPNFRAKALKFQKAIEAAGHKVEILETYRSPARQMQLFREGFTELRNVGVHGYGLAADFALFVNGKYDPKGQDYIFFAKIAKDCDIISGYDWGLPDQPHSFRDYDHVQGVPLFRQHELFTGQWYPDASYSPWEDELSRGLIS